MKYVTEKDVLSVIETVAKRCESMNDDGSAKCVRDTIDIIKGLGGVDVTTCENCYFVEKNGRRLLCTNPYVGFLKKVNEGEFCPHGKDGRYVY